MHEGEPEHDASWSEPKRVKGSAFANAMQIGAKYNDYVGTR